MVKLLPIDYDVQNRLWMKKQVVAKANPYHDKLGRFTSKDKAGGSVDHVKAKSGPKGKGKHTMAAATKLLSDAGWKVRKLATMPPDFRKAAQIIGEGTITDAHYAALKGVAKAMQTIRKSPKLASIADSLQVVIADYDPKGAAMSAATGFGVAFMLFNTKHQPTVGEGVDGTPWSIGSMLSAEVKKKGISEEESLAVEYELSVYHEFGHFVDRAAENALTDMMVDVLGSKVAAKAGTPEAIPKFLADNVSGYAATSPKDAAAEVFSMVMAGIPVPEELKDVEEIIRNEILR